jgi:hypothetical protein
MANKFKDTISNTLSNVSSKLEANGEKTGALLFTNSQSNGKFGQIYLFSQFGIAENSTFTRKSQITTHYTEENYAINDHWAIEPIEYILSGLIGEVIYRPSKNWANKLQEKIPNYVTGLSVISPTFDNYTTSAINLTQAVEESYNRYKQLAKNALRSIGYGSSPTTSNQKKVADELNSLIDNKQLVTVYTPFGVLENMAILNASLTQEKSLYQSRLEVTLQEWRDTATRTREATEHEKSELARVQGAVSSNSGQASSVNVSMSENSTLKSFFNPNG